jgi:hypothetical protein
MLAIHNIKSIGSSGLPEIHETVTSNCRVYFSGNPLRFYYDNNIMWFVSCSNPTPVHVQHCGVGTTGAPDAGAP